MDNTIAALAAEGVTVTLTWQTIITAAAVVTAATALVGFLAKFIRWVDKQKEQDGKIQALDARHTSDTITIQSELRILTHGVLACLKGLSEKGCNGPVTQAIRELEDFINNKAHDMKEE